MPSPALHAAGSRVAILDLDQQASSAAAAQIGCAGFAADVRDRTAVTAAWQDIGTELGVPTMLVNSAGIGGWGSALDYPEQLWRDVIDINLTGTFKRKHSPHVLRVICGSGSAALYGEIACAGGCQGVPSMRSHRTAKAFRPCLRAVSM